MTVCFCASNRDRPPTRDGRARPTLAFDWTSSRRLFLIIHLIYDTTPALRSETRTSPLPPARLAGSRKKTKKPIGSRLVPHASVAVAPPRPLASLKNAQNVSEYPGIFAIPGK